MTKDEFITYLDVLLASEDKQIQKARDRGHEDDEAYSQVD